jgi:hypothetical protein
VEDSGAGSGDADAGGDTEPADTDSDAIADTAADTAADTGDGGGGSDTSGATDTSTDGWLTFDCHNDFIFGGAPAECGVRSCVSEGRAAFGPSFPLEIGGPCAAFFACVAACDCTAGEDVFASPCGEACGATLTPACATPGEAFTECAATSCEPSVFVCDDGIEVAASAVCDAVADCAGGEDEAGCTGRLCLRRWHYGAERVGVRRVRGLLQRLR